MEDEEYDIRSEDYVFARQNSHVVQNALSRGNQRGPFQISTWEQYLEVGDYWFTGGLYGEGQLIYADANRKDPEHRKSVQNIEAMKPLLTEAEKETEEAKRILISFIQQAWADRRKRDDIEIEGDEYTTEGEGDRTPKDDDEAEEKLSDEDAILFAYKRTAFGHVDKKLMDFILGLEDPRMKREVLRIIKHQMMTPKPRPVMILIALFESFKPKEGSGKSGWAVGYDIVTNKILIKSFNVKVDEHPLAENWYHGSDVDALYVAESPETFVSNMTSSKKAQLLGDDENYRSVLTYFAGKWLECHSLALKFSIDTMDSLQDTVDDIESRLRTETFPEIPQPIMFNAAQEKCIDLKSMMIQTEDMLRDTAVRAKEEGHETSAINLAKYFERVLRDLTQMIENPDIPLEG